jgi:hypothetical protein
MYPRIPTAAYRVPATTYAMAMSALRVAGLTFCTRGCTTLWRKKDSIIYLIMKRECGGEWKEEKRGKVKTKVRFHTTPKKARKSKRLLTMPPMPENAGVASVTTWNAPSPYL